MNQIVRRGNVTAIEPWVTEDHYHIKPREPRKSFLNKSILRMFNFGCFALLMGILLIPAVGAGGVITIIAWDLYPHSHAIVYGSAVSLAFAFMSFWIMYAVIMVLEAIYDKDAE